jgi:C1A family cysteine protease
MRGLLAATVLLACPCAAYSQGAILEKLEDLHDAQAPPTFRGGVPQRVNLSPKMPPVRSQLPTSTCVSWAATYAATSFALRTRGFASDLTLSPSFTYNQLSRDQWCRLGTAISPTLNLLRDIGAVPLPEFAFDGGWCGRQPTPAELDVAKQFRIRNWSAFDAGVVEKVKEQLARGVPVIFAMRYTAKMNSLKGQSVFSDDDTPGDGHSMVAVGYDDAKRAFLIQNSFGRTWGFDGYGWFGYEFWARNAGPGYVIE